MPSTRLRTIAAKEAELAAVVAREAKLREALEDIAEDRMPTHRPDGARWWYNGGEGFAEWAKLHARAAIAKHGGKIVWGEGA